MYTQCSHCKATFRVTMKELTAAQGLLRCSECDTIFDAMKALSAILPEEVPIQLPVAPSTRQMPAESTARGWFAWLPWSQERYPDAYARHASHLQRQTNTPARWWLLVSLLALSMLLLLQIAYGTRHWLINQPVIGPLLEHSVCAYIDCRLMPKRDLKNIHMLSRNVFSHPNSPGILIIRASFENQANFKQPYPYVEISFLNKASEVVALRRFSPSEYLSKAESADATPNALMPIKTPRELSVTIKDPGLDAVRFQFSFL